MYLVEIWDSVRVRREQVVNGENNLRYEESRHISYQLEGPKRSINLA